MIKSKREIYEQIDALNFSRAKLLLRSARAFHFDYPEEPPAEKYASLRIGTLVHAVLLEGLDLSKCLAIKPEGMSFVTREGKVWRAAQSKPIVTQTEAYDVYGMVGAILDHGFAREILSTCIRREVIYTANLWDVSCKCLIDAIGDANGTPAVVEIKTSVDIREDFFARRVISEPYHYDLQCVWYRTVPKFRNGNGAGISTSCWIVVENHPPFDVAVYFPSTEILYSGMQKMQKVISTYKTCLSNDSWPGAETEPKILRPPGWYRPPVLRDSETLMLQEPPRNLEDRTEQ